MDVEVRVRIRPNFKFYAAVTVYSRRAFLFGLISLIFILTSYILSSTFQFKKILDDKQNLINICCKKHEGTNLTQTHEFLIFNHMWQLQATNRQNRRYILF